MAGNAPHSAPFRPQARRGKRMSRLGGLAEGGSLAPNILFSWVRSVPHFSISSVTNFRVSAEKLADRGEHAWDPQSCWRHALAQLSRSSGCGKDRSVGWMCTAETQAGGPRPPEPRLRGPLSLRHERLVGYPQTDSSGRRCAARSSVARRASGSRNSPMSPLIRFGRSSRRGSFKIQPYLASSS